ncbi:hypothetical protein A3L12_01145 [Thermococcus sp. P6]|nr:hypothetical protein A3L12_01145 [Thermococcus sp. P6]
MDIDTRNSPYPSNYTKGYGYFILAKGIGIVKLWFNRTAGIYAGTTVTYTYENHTSMEKHTISGTIKTPEGDPVKGVVVQISNCDPCIRSVTDSTGSFSIQAYGPDIVLRVGYDKDNDGTFDFDLYPDFPMEFHINNITSDITGLVLTIPMRVFYVPDDYTTIQEAINNARPGDTIIVRDGTYNENVIVNKSITLKSENGPANCIINGTGSGSVVTITADNVTIQGFTITGSGSGWGNGGVWVESSGNTISSNVITNNGNGIYLDSSSNNNITSNNITSNSGNGVYLDSSSHNNITFNNITSNNWAGIWLRGSSNTTITSNNITSNGERGIFLYYSSYNIVTNNTMTNDGIVIEGYKIEHWNTHVIENNTVNGKPVYYFKNRVGGNVPEDAGQVILANTTGMLIENLNISNTDVGIELGFSSNNTIKNSNITSNNREGIYLYYSSNNNITSNNITSNSGAGIFIYGSSNNNIVSNNITSNAWAGIWLDSSNNNTIYLNNFNNTNNVYSENSINIWNSPTPIKYTYNGTTHTSHPGNYWSDYTGSDSDGDGIGDTQYIIDANNKDEYPLVQPRENYNLNPVANFTYSPENPEVNQTVTFNASSSYDPDGSIVNWTWGFGDGITASGKTVQHTYTKPGTYTVTLTVTDDDGATSNISKRITVATPSIQFVDVTDGNDDVFISGETVTIRFNADNSSLSPDDVTFSNITGNVSNALAPSLKTISSEIINNVTYWTYELNVTVSGHGILRVYVCGQTLTDLYVYEVTESSVWSIGAGKEVTGGGNILINDELQINATLEGPEVPEHYALPTPDNAELYVPAFESTLNFVKYNSTEGKWYFSNNFTMRTNGTFTLNITNEHGINFTTNTEVHVLQPVIKLLPINNGTANQKLVEYANLTNGTQNNLTLSLHYDLTVELTPGVNWTEVDGNNSVNSNVYENESASNLTFLNGAKVTVIDGTLSTATLTIKVKNLGVVYTKDFVILPEDEPAAMELNATEVVKGEPFKISLAITKPNWNGTTEYNLTLVNGSHEYPVATNVPVTNEYVDYIVDTSTMNNLPVGTYNVVFFMSNGTSNYTTVQNVTIKENLTLKHKESPWGAYYPSDTVTFNGTFLRIDEFDSTNVNITVYQKNAAGQWVDAGANATNSSIIINSTAKTYNFTVTFNAPGEFKVIVNETDIPNVEACNPITISDHKVTLSENSSVINLGTSVTIQVTTTANVSASDLNITGAPLEPQVSEAEAFNSTTHLKVFNVTFTTNGSTKLGSWPINITVDNGEVKVFTLEVTDELTPVYVPSKVVLGSKMFMILNTTANLTAGEYDVTVWAFGVTTTEASGLSVSLGDYNDGYRLLNVTFDITQNIYSKDPENYPTHYMNVTDGHLWIEKQFEIVEDPALYIEPVGTVVVGQNVTFEGTTLLAPGEYVTVNITKVDQENVFEVPVKLDTSGDENVFTFSHKFIEPGLYNVTVNWSKYKHTIQVNVTNEGVLSLNTDRNEYYPDGKIKITGQLDNVTEDDAITLKFYWVRGNATSSADLVNGSYEYYFDMDMNDVQPGDLRIEATYYGNANATKTVTITDTPVIENVVVPAKPVKAGELFNVTADTNLGINGTVALEIVKADNASDVKFNGNVKVSEGGAFLYTVNTTDWTAGYYNITLSKGSVEVSKQVYIYVTGANIRLVDGSLVVEPLNGTAPLTINVKANVTNTGDLDGTYTAELMVNNITVKNVTVTVPFGEVVPVEFNYTLEESGVYNVTIGDLTPVEVTVLKPATPEFSNLTVEPLNGTAPLDITASAVVKNIGEVSGTFTVEFKVNGEVKATREVELAAGANTTVEFNYTLEEPGVYNVTIGDLTPVQVTVEKKPYATVDEYVQRVGSAGTVYFVFNNLGTPDAYSTAFYMSRTVGGARTKSVPAKDFNMSAVNASDVVISVGGPLVNPVTAAYEDIAPVHMLINGSNVTIVTPNTNFTWSAPKPWWNATEGYFIIQVFQDDNTGAFVVTIYGTDADSTAAGAYYFMSNVYPNLANYTGIRYLVGLWQDTELGADIPLPGEDLGDTSGFSAGDTITIVEMG